MANEEVEGADQHSRIMQDTGPGEPAPTPEQATREQEMGGHPGDRGEPLAPMDASGNEPDFQPVSEKEQFLFSSEAPGSQFFGHQRPGSMMGGSPPLPRGMHEWLPDLGRAAMDPHAPPQVKQLFALIMHHVEQAMKQE